MSNLDAFSDGLRVLTTILAERSRAYLRRLFMRRVPAREPRGSGSGTLSMRSQS